MATAELPFDLIEAKLAPPALRVDTVVKSELIDRLRASRARAVSVVAPAGFGKTTLLAHLAERDERSFATVALDERDNDPVVLLRYVAAALDRVEPVPASVFEALSTPGRSVWSTCIPRVCAALSAVSSPVVLVLDDLHFVSDPTCLDAVAALHRPRSRAIADRGVEPGGACAAAGAPAGAGARAGDRRGRSAPERGGGGDAAAQRGRRARRRRRRRAHGADRGLAGGPVSRRAVAAGGRRRSGSGRGVQRRRPVRGRLSAVRAAVAADGRGGALPDAHVGARSDVRRPLRRGPRTHTTPRACSSRSSAANRFLVPLDRSRTWYRYHHLFRDLLRSELELREPEIAPELNRRAMAWCEANGHARAGAALCPRGRGDRRRHPPDRAAHPADVVRRRRRHARVMARLVRRRRLRARYPTIAVLGAWVYYLTGRPAEGARWERAAQTSTATPELPDGSASIEPWIAALRALHVPRRDRADARGRRAGARAARPRRLVATDRAARRRRRARVARRRRSAAAKRSRSQPSWRQRPAHPRRRAAAFAELAFAGDRGGSVGGSRDPRRAGGGDRRGGAGSTTTSRAGSRSPPPRASRSTTETSKQAREDVARIHRLRPLFNHGLPWMSVQIGLELARIHLALGEAGVAGTVLSEAEAHPARPPTPRHAGRAGERAPATRRGHVDAERRSGR